MTVPHSNSIRNHWYWRPGWGVGSRFYAWHITFDGQPEVAELADRHRPLLSPHPSLDVIPSRWLHLTMQGLGFVQDVAAADVNAIVAAARDRCGQLAPFALTIGAPHVDPESIQIAVAPVEPVRQLRAAIRAVIADVWGADRVPEAVEPYHPHLSLAYTNTDASAVPLIETLKDAPKIHADAVIDSCQLIVLHRDEGMYVWEPYATVKLGS
ncbi:2'-5' RNA ligase family protein [Micromonospora sp. WMMD980]|uniref:2'-5' RNA ligase family protein n=1 Tax=Micromonospora sp. WMMD980 TaxID=3016088 RepID=UPI002417BF1D|nr:2'-5' RNA ligase family protein [Micromonospora sp. WMMD980]MDG4803588.1 2'-5' RNA ligase family protein [Micromonospora sp. WMMD980]